MSSEKLLRDDLFVGGTHLKPTYGLRGSGEPHEDFQAKPDAEAFKKKQPRPILPFSHQIGARRVTRTYPRIDVSSLRSDIVRPEPGLETGDYNELPYLGKTLQAEHMRAYGRRLAAVMAANPDRLFSITEAMTALGDDLLEDSRDQYLTHLLRDIYNWHLTQPNEEVPERYIEVVQDKTTNDRYLRMVSSKQGVGWTGFKEAGLGWLVEGLDPYRKEFQIGHIAVQATGMNLHQQRAMRVVLGHAGRAFNTEMLGSLHVNLSPDGQMREARQLVRGLQDGNAAAFVVSRVIFMTEPDLVRGGRLIWAAAPSGISDEARFNTPRSQAPPLVTEPT